jgi:dinuclear metal center YbgI/SA1388 family protein
MKKMISWLDEFLQVSKFDDVSNNGVQISPRSQKIGTVAFAVDASVKNIRAADEVGADLLIVHHGISWGGGIKRITGSMYNVISAAIQSGIGLYASHLPLDANKECGNNWEIARALKMTQIKKAFSYHGNVIGVVGKLSQVERIGEVFPQVKDEIKGMSGALKLGVCSGGAGDFAEKAKELGCDLYLTGEASWGDVIACENSEMKMLCAGHYETEVFGVRALSKILADRFNVKTVDLTEEK